MDPHKQVSDDQQPRKLASPTKGSIHGINEVTINNKLTAKPTLEGSSAKESVDCSHKVYDQVISFYNSFPKFCLSVYY